MARGPGDFGEGKQDPELKKAVELASGWMESIDDVELAASVHGTARKQVLRGSRGRARRRSHLAGAAVF